MTKIPPLVVPDVETHYLDARALEQRFQIQVMQPRQPLGARNDLPVLYMTDANLGFDFAKSFAHSLEFNGLVTPFILVGIGYPGANPFAGSLLRCRDLTLVGRPRIPDMPMHSDIVGVAGLDSSGPTWNGAPAFLRFLSEELLPFIESRYPAAPRRALFGHSLGGGFAIADLFSASPHFDDYIIGSPALSHGESEYGLDIVRAYLAGQRRSRPAKVYLSVGEFEEREPGYLRSRFVTSVQQLVALISEAECPEIHMAHEVLRGEQHITAWPQSFIRGTQAIFPGPSAVAPPVMRAVERCAPEAQSDSDEEPSQ